MKTLAPRATRRQQRWRAADFAQRRRCIIEAALDLLRQHGPAGVTMRRVAQRLGVGAMTLYTYVRSQEELRRAMTQRGFDLLQQGCEAASTLGTPLAWRGGAAYYLRFALENPQLYELMFSTPMAPEGAAPPGPEPADGRADPADRAILENAFKPFVERVRERLARQGLSGADLEARALAAAGQFWIALHGLASLAIAGRLVVLGGRLDDLLDQLLQRVAPD